MLAWSAWRVSVHTLCKHSQLTQIITSTVCVSDSPWLQEAAKHADEEGESVPLGDAASPQDLLGDVQL